MGKRLAQIQAWTHKTPNDSDVMIKLLNDDFLHVNSADIPPINLILNSPPFNVGVNYLTHDDTMPYENYLDWSKKWIDKCFSLQPVSGRIVINVPFSCNPRHLNKIKDNDKNVYPLAADLTKVCQSSGYKYYRTIIWKKIGANKTSWGSWRSASSPCIIDPNEALLVFYKEQWKRATSGTSTISGKEFMIYIKNVWDIPPETRSKHPAPFSVPLSNAIIKMFSYKEDTVMDNFLGSGTSGESAVRLGRSFIGIEKSEEYFKMAKERIDTAEIQTSLISSIMPDGDEDDD